jgi:hypothetical protein
MGRRRQTKEQFIKSREDARATEAKAAEAKRIQDEALARRSANRTRLDLYRNKFRQPVQPGGTSNPTAEMQQQPAQPGMASNAIGSTVGNQVVGGSDKTMVQPGLQENVQKFNLGGIVQPFADPNMNNFENSFSKPSPIMLSDTPYTEKSTPMREDTRFLTYKDGLNDFDANKKEIPLVASPEERKSQQAIAPVAYEDKYGGFGGSGKTADELKESTLPAPKAAEKEEEEKEEDFDVNSFFKSIKSKEAPEATQYKTFTVGDDSSQVKDVMSARREALMKMMGGR